MERPSPFARSQILETKNIETLIPLVDAKTWLLIDLDNTLFESTDLYGHVNWFYQEIDQRLACGMTKKEAILDFHPQWEKAQSLCQVKAVDIAFIELIHTLQKQSITLMGLTHRQPILAQSTLRQVASLGLDLSLTAPSHESLTLKCDPIALYQRGILFVGDFNYKGDIFNRFCDEIEKKPSQVLFVDDKLYHLQEVEKALTSRQIAFIGIHYTAVHSI